MFALVLLIAIVEMIITRDPESTENPAVVQARQAMGAHKSALEKSPQNAEAHYQLGRDYFIAHDYPQAQKYFANAVKYDDANPRYHEALANVYRDTRDYDGAVREYRRAIELSPSALNSYYSLATIYETVRGDAEAALGLYDQALAAFGGSTPRGDIELRKAHLLVRMNRRDEAKTFIDEALSRNPSHQTLRAYRNSL